MDTQEVHPYTQENLSSHTAKMTLEEFLKSDIEGYEYVEGELVPMPPTSGEHGDISMNLISQLNTYVRENHLGRIYAPDTGFQNHLPF